jgi:hypothetical protein
MSLRKLVLVAAIAVAPACGQVASARDVTCESTPDKFLPNASFDDDSPAWTQEVTGGASTPKLLCGTDTNTPADGAHDACMGGMDGQIQSLSQTVSLPDGLNTVTLNGQICITTQETGAVANDTLKIELLDGAQVIATLGQFSNLDVKAQPCQFQAFAPLTATVSADPAEATLRLRSTLNTQDTTSFFIDALQLTVGCKAP